MIPVAMASPRSLMAIAALPSELHKVIIDHVSDDWSDSDSDWDSEDEESSSKPTPLQSCTLVCRSWNNYALRRIFATIQIPGFHPREEERARWERLLQLMEINPDIGRSIRTLAVNLFPSTTTEDPFYSDQTLEKILLRSTHVVNLHIQNIPDDLLTRPSIINGLTCLLQYPSLHGVTTHSNTLRTSLFNSMSRIKFLHLMDVSSIIVDHKLSISLETLEKLDVYRSRAVMKAMQFIPTFRSLFDHIHHFHLHDEINCAAFRPWDRRMELTKLTSLALIVSGMRHMGAETISMCESFPWSSAQGLSRLKLYFDFTGVEDAPVTPSQPAGTSSPPLLLVGPSTLPRLQELRLNYSLPELIDNDARLSEVLQELFKGCLEPTFGKKGAFPNLKEFGIAIEMSGTYAVAEMDASVLQKRVMQLLPSVFGPKGRREVDAWDAAVRGTWNSTEGGDFGLGDSEDEL